jgi:hypothetical protein
MGWVVKAKHRPLYPLESQARWKDSRALRRAEFSTFRNVATCYRNCVATPDDRVHGLRDQVQRGNSPSDVTVVSYQWDVLLSACTSHVTSRIWIICMPNLNICLLLLIKSCHKHEAVASVHNIWRYVMPTSTRFPDPRRLSRVMIMLRALQPRNGGSNPGAGIFVWPNQSPGQ